MPRRLSAFAALAIPFALAAVVELARGLQSAGASRIWIARFAGLVAIGEIVVGIVLGAAMAGAASREGLARRMPAVALGTAAFLTALVQLAEGFPPALPAWSVSPVRAIAIAAACALVAGGARGLAGRPDLSVRAVVCAPAALVVGAAAARRVAASWDASPGSTRGLLIGAATLAVALAVGMLAERLPVWRGERASRLLVGLLVAAPLAGAIGAVAWGRSLAGSLPARPSGPPDVLVVVVDTARADALPSPPGAPFPTPVVAGLRAEGASWSRAFSTSCWTLPAHVSLFTGLDAASHGVGWESQHLPEGLETLATRFERAGWRTAGFSANPWVAPEFGLDRGFERFVAADVARPPRRPWLVRFAPRLFDRFEAPLLYEDKRGRLLVAEALRFLADEDRRPAFVFLNLLEPHLSYDPPSRYLPALAAQGIAGGEFRAIDQDRLRDLDPRRVPTQREVEILRRLYAAEVAYADSLLGRIVDALRRAGRLDAAIVAVTSDHGENLGEHPPLDHQLGLWETLVRVPLVVRYPAALPAGTTSDRLTSLSEVPGAVYRLATTRPEAGAMLTGDGEPVTASYDRPGPILEQIRARLGLDPAPWDRRLDAIRSGSRKWVRASDGRHEAYDLDADPGERRNLFEGKAIPAGFEALAESLSLRVAGVAPRPPPGARRDVDEDTMRRLRSLGYVN